MSFFSLRAFSNASGPQAYQSVGLWECISKYGLVSFASRLVCFGFPLAGSPAADSPAADSPAAAQTVTIKKTDTARGIIECLSEKRDYACGFAGLTAHSL